MSESAFHPEDKARSLIDRRLVSSGWLIQSKTEMNLGAGLGVAVREFQTASGPVDYGLFVGRRLCGVIEAKPEGTTLSGFSEQAARYIADVPKHLVREEGQVRFEYVASGTETLFRDHADPDPTSRRVFTFHRPETLDRWLKEPATLRGRLQAMPAVVNDGLRDCQIDAVAALERSMAQNHPRALVQMATGAGKTFTACTLSYRLLAHAGFKRILFLADRANLVRQTRDEYLAYRPPGTGRSFSEIYNVQKLGAAGLDKDAQIVVATIQRVYSVLTGKELPEDEEESSSFETVSADTERLVAYNPSIPIESFDLVITDECHRSIYGTWRQVLEYFDAFTVGLTATPSRCVSNEQILRRGDIVLTMSSGSVSLIGKSAWVGSPQYEMTFGAFCACIRTTDRDVSRLIYWLLQTSFYRGRITNSAKGTNISNLKREHLELLPVPIAPLPELRRIVGRLDELFAEIAEGEAALVAARKGLDTFRRSLVKAAVTGELTKDWRATNSVSETGHDILTCLRKRYPNVSPTRAGWKPKSDLPPLPEGWTWCAIEEAGEVQLGRQRAPQHHDGDNMRPYLRVANVLEDRLDLSDVKWMNFTPAEFKTFALRPGDILLNEGQAPDLLGRPAMYNGEIVECCFQKTLLRFRAKVGVLPDYALIVFRHYMRSGRFKRESRITTNIGHLTQVRFVVMEFPLPPEAEQRVIVELFREYEGAATDVVTVLDAETADAARLKQSILKAAFEGRLTPQDPADEPASAMLARSVANRAIPAVSRGRTRKSDA